MTLNFRNVPAMKLPILAAIFLVSLIALANVTKLPSKYLQMIKNPKDFSEIKLTKDLPPPIISLCTQGGSRLANPGENWQATDVIVEEALPDRRLIWAVNKGDDYVIHYEGGGYAHSYHLLIATFDAKSKKATVVWRAIVMGHLPAFKDLDAAITNNQLDDSRNYSY